MYILDEPSIGLHQRDNERLLRTLTHLRDLGNTVIVVEHDEDAIRSADHIIDIGPGAGVHGGTIVAQGSLEAIMAEERSLTGAYLSGATHHPDPGTAPRDPTIAPAAAARRLRQQPANGRPGHPCRLFMTCVTGVSGSGKSTLINGTLYPLAATALNGATTLTAAAHESIEGLEHIDKCIDIDQSPIGRTPRSNPATYTGIFTRSASFSPDPGGALARLQARALQLQRQGRALRGLPGRRRHKVEMHFLPDIYVPCDVCKGKRYNRETLDIRYKGCNIHEVLEMTVEDALAFFEAVPAIARKLQTLMDVGLSYIRLGQAATTLSGGEAQRVKLSRELSKARHGPDAVHPRRAHHGAALRGHPPAAGRAAPTARPRQHGGDHRAQPRCHQNRRLDRRPGPGGRQRRRRDHRHRHTGGRRRESRVAHGSLPGAATASARKRGQGKKLGGSGNSSRAA
jgi:excinuclease ABC subunit A